jgi:hypothetical protein
MPDSDSKPEPFQSGDSLTICHDGGQTAEVFFCGVFGNKFDQIYIRWPLAGEYKVKVDTGRLVLNSVRSWRVCDKDMVRLAATKAAEKASARERVMNRRTGGGW